MPQNIALLSVLRTALDMEREGRDFYRRAMLECKSDAARSVFQMLAEEEVAHIDVIHTLYERVSGGRDWQADLTALEATTPRQDVDAFFYHLAAHFEPATAACTDDLEAVAVGLAFERRAVALYEDRLSAATDAQERSLLRKLAGEERAHVALLVDMQSYLEDPQGWFERVGRSLLDGA